MLVAVCPVDVGGGGPAGTPIDFGTTCGLPCNRCTSLGSAGNGFFVTGSF